MTEARPVHTDLEHLLGSLLELVQRCQREILDLRLEEVYANCLSALSARCGGGPAVLLMVQGKTLRLELASDLLPFANDILTLDLHPIEKQHPLDSQAACEQTKRVLTESIQHSCPTRDVFVHCLQNHGQIQGALVQTSVEGQTLDANLTNSLKRLSAGIQLIINTAIQFKKLLKQSSLDSMTGLYNQRYFIFRLREELARASRHGHSLGLLYCDLDGFRDCNQRWGQTTCNRLLEEVARLLRSTDPVTAGRFCFRRSDVAIRNSGEEFAVILPETPKWGVLTKAERLRKEIEALKTPTQGKSLTASIGAAAFPEDAADATSLVEAALQGMLKAKKAGGNRVEPA